MVKAKLDGGHVLRTTITVKVTGRKSAIHEEVWIDHDPTKLPASKIAGEIAKGWKEAQADPNLAGKPMTISIRLTPRKV